MPCHVMRICIFMDAWHGRTLMKGEVRLAMRSWGVLGRRMFPEWGLLYRPLVFFHEHLSLFEAVSRCGERAN
jgi:hypothetical protein